MRDKQEPLCDLCLSVITGECTEEERLDFERHLPGCEACRAEWNDLQPAWGALYGAAPTSGQEAYQVWLLKNGVRTSAGTFRVASGDRQGLGVLAMPIGSDRLDFDKIGITPRAGRPGDRPRGEKMFGSV